MSTTRTPGAAHKGAPSSSHCLLLAALAVGATAVIAGLGSAPVAVTAGGLRAPHAGPRITPEEAIALATGLEVGENDFRISDMGWGWASSRPTFPTAAYNSVEDEYLVVWSGFDTTYGLAPLEYEIFCQRIQAGTGALLGGQIRISDMGPVGDDYFRARSPAVAYDSTDNEYLVVWSGNDGSGTMDDGEDEIFGQRIDGVTGLAVGDNDFRISDMGPDGDYHFDAADPALAYNTTDNEYLVVWRGDNGSGAMVDDEDEIWGQRINAATGLEIGGDFRISDMGGVGRRG